MSARHKQTRKYDVQHLCCCELVQQQAVGAGEHRWMLLCFEIDYTASDAAAAADAAAKPPPKHLRSTTSKCLPTYQLPYEPINQLPIKYLLARQSYAG